MSNLASFRARSLAALMLGASALAVDAGNGVTASNTIAVGTGAEATANSAIAVGNGAAATGVNSIAIGTGALATGSVAVGNNATAMNGGAAFGDNSSATGSLATAIGPGAVASAANSTAIGAGSVANQPNTVSVGTPGNLRQITNVADGTGPNDALTVEQGQAIGASAVAQANAFTDSRFNQLSNTVQTVSKRADAAVASAIASSDLPQPIHPGHGELAIGVGGFNGQAGLAVGASFRFNDDRTSIRGSVNVTDEGEAGGGAAIGFEF